MYTRKSTTLTLNKQCSMIQKVILIHSNIISERFPMHFLRLDCLILNTTITCNCGSKCTPLTSFKLDGIPLVGNITI